MRDNTTVTLNSNDETWVSLTMSWICDFAMLLGVIVGGYWASSLLSLVFDSADEVNYSMGYYAILLAAVDSLRGQKQGFYMTWA